LPEEEEVLQEDVGLPGEEQIESGTEPETESETESGTEPGQTCGAELTGEIKEGVQQLAKNKLKIYSKT